MKAIFKKIFFTDDFNKDLKKLTKRFRTLHEDLDNFIEFQLRLFHKLITDNGSIKQIPGLTTKYIIIYKARKFACKSLKGRGAHSGIRIIYAYDKKEDRLTFVEIYCKGDREKEDRKRIKDFLDREK